MPQVPIKRIPEIMPSRAPGVFQNIDASPIARGGAAIGQALQSFGQNLGEFGSKLAAEQTKTENESAVADANNAYLSAQEEQAPLAANYYSLEGKNAVNAYPEYMQSLKEIRERHLKNLGNDKAKKLFDNEYTRELASEYGSGGRHAAQQQKIYQSLTSDARVEQAVKDSASKFNDNGLFASNQEVIGRELDFKAHSEGWSEDKLSYEKSKAQGLAYAARIREMSIYDPYNAQQLYSSSRDKLSPDQAIALQESIKTSADSLGVRSAANQIYGNGPMARAGVVGAMRVLAPRPSADVRNVDPRLPDLLARGSVYLPEGYHIRINGGYTPYGHAEGSQHHVKGRGALDVQIIDPQGIDIPNRGEDKTGLYTLLTRGMYKEMLANYPELRGVFAWGGNFGVTKGSKVRDLMHYDLGGERGSLATTDYQSGMGSANAVTGLPGLPTRSSNLVSRVIQAESGGRGGLMSSAGAVGIMQILPSTGRAWASRLGLPWNETSLRFDTKYNTLIGTAILNNLLAKYGNETVAVAAYNAGEGNVNKWLQKYGNPRDGGISDAEWASKIPFTETRNYVQKVASAVGGTGNVTVDYLRGPMVGGAAAGGDNRKGWDQIQTEAQEFARMHWPDDSVFEDRLITELHSRYTRDNGAQSEAEKAAFDSLMTDVIENKRTNLDEIERDKALRAAWDTIGGEKKAQIFTQMRTNASGDIAEDGKNQADYFEVRGKASSNPGFLESYDIWGDNGMTRSQREDLDRLKRENRAAAGKTLPGMKVNANSAMAVMGSALDAAGLAPPAPTALRDKDADALAIMRRRNIYQGMFVQKLEEATKAKGKQLGDSEVQAIGNKLLEQIPFQNVIKGESGWFSNDYYFAGDRGDYQEPEGGVYEFELSDLPTFMKTYNLSQDAAVITLLAQVPDSIEKQITDSFIRKGKGKPTPLDVLHIYRSMLAAGKNVPPAPTEPVNIYEAAPPVVAPTSPNSPLGPKVPTGQ